MNKDNFPFKKGYRITQQEQIDHLNQLNQLYQFDQFAQFNSFPQLPVANPIQPIINYQPMSSKSSFDNNNNINDDDLDLDFDLSDLSDEELYEEKEREINKQNAIRQQKLKDNNKIRKQRQTKNTKLDECVLLGLIAFYTDVTIRTTKVKKIHELERYIIENVADDTIQSVVDRLFAEYLKTIASLGKPVPKRTIQQSRQNIYYNCFIEYLRESGNVITETLSKSGQMMIKRKRFKTINGRSLLDCRRFGEAMNYHIQDLIPSPKSKKEGVLILKREHVVLIMEQHPMSSITNSDHFYF